MDISRDSDSSSMPHSNGHMSETKPDINQLRITNPGTVSPHISMPHPSYHPSPQSSMLHTAGGRYYAPPTGYYDMGGLLQVHPTSGFCPSPQVSSIGTMGYTGSSSKMFTPMSSGIGIGKHTCAICGDRASGKHYGVYSCEGCKGFFKRTVRKDLQYACRDEKSCLIDKRQRNRCQFCRYMKCLSTGMKREAVQEERHRARERCFDSDGVESTTCSGGEMHPEILLQAELAFEAQLQDIGGDVGAEGEGMMYQAADRHVYALVDWVKRLPHFVELSPEDQVILLKTGWNELMIAGCAHQSILPSVARNSLVVAPGLVLHGVEAGQVIGLTGPVFDRVITEIVDKMRDMDVDKTELGCLRAIILFNPDAKGLSTSQPIESLRERVYTTLEDHCRQRCPDDHGRFAKLLLRLPALRSIGLKCREPIFFSFRLGLETQDLDGFLMDSLENPNPSC